MSRYAVMDVGSNSLKMYVGRVVHGRVTDLADLAVVTRLGEGLAETGELSEEAMDRTVAELKRFKARAESLGVDKIVSVGTQAVRQATNGREFATLVRNRCRMGFRVISGEAEAQLAYLAATSSLDLGEGAVTIFDTGGGSTEVVRGMDGRLRDVVSLKIGSRVLTDRFCKTDPVTVDEFAALSAAVAAALDDVPVDDIRSSGGRLVGIGTTAVSLAAVHLGLSEDEDARTHGFILPGRVVETAAARLREMTLIERRRLQGLRPERADVMLAAAAIVAGLMSRLGAVEMTVCNRGLRHGLFHDRFCS